MTSHEFLFEHGSDVRTMGDDDSKVCYCVIQPKDLIAFAQLKVKEALEIAAKKALINLTPLEGNYHTEAETSSSFEADVGYEDCYMVEYSINKESIINSYPLDNIK